MYQSLSVCDWYSITQTPQKIKYVLRVSTADIACTMLST